MHSDLAPMAKLETSMGPWEIGPYRVGHEHGPPCLPDGHDISVLGKYRKAVFGQGPGSDMENTRGELARDDVPSRGHLSYMSCTVALHVGDH